jgi:hypothetical protein
MEKDVSGAEVEEEIIFSTKLGGRVRVNVPVGRRLVRYLGLGYSNSMVRKRSPLLTVNSTIKATKIKHHRSTMSRTTITTHVGRTWLARNKLLSSYFDPITPVTAKSR